MRWGEGGGRVEFETSRAGSQWAFVFDENMFYCELSCLNFHTGEEGGGGGARTEFEMGRSWIVNFHV